MNKMPRMEEKSNTNRNVALALKEGGCPPPDSSGRPASTLWTD